jgi:hypothetical protein
MSNIEMSKYRNVECRQTVWYLFYRQLWKDK